MTSPTKALIVDVDGVVSPVHGHTAWGDDTIAGHLFGPVVVSPTMCQRLDALAEFPGVTAAWLTSWPAAARQRMDPFPGPGWPEVADPTTAMAEHKHAWWKWTALTRWLDSRTEITHLAWVDDHLANTPASVLSFRAPTKIASAEGCQPRSDVRSIVAMLVAPDTAVGLTPVQLGEVEAFLAADQ